MKRIVLSPKAHSDLEGIWDYTAERWSAEQAEDYLRTVWKEIEALASGAKRAQSCDDVRKGYWKYPAGSHVIFFRLVDDAMDIVRILHQRMDFEKHLK